MNTISNFLDDNIINAIAWSVIHTLWQASLIALIMSALLHIYRNESAEKRYYISLGALSMVLISAVVTFMIYLEPSSSTVTTSIGESIAVFASGSLAEASLIQKLNNFFSANIDFISNVWFIGVVVFLVKFLMGYAHINYLSSGQNHQTSQKLLYSVHKLKSRIGINANIRVIETAKVHTPMILGFLKPTILFPLGVVNNLSTSEVEAILAHELAHIKRNDFLINLLQSLTEVLFYYHPAVWWISANVRLERENCCDDIALKYSDSSISYAKVLVKLQEIKSHALPSLAIPFSGSQQNLLNRIKRILNQPQTRSNIREKLVATLLLLTMVLAFTDEVKSVSAISDEMTVMEQIREELASQEEEEVVVEVNMPENVFEGEQEKIYIVHKNDEKDRVDRLREKIGQQVFASVKRPSKTYVVVNPANRYYFSPRTITIDTFPGKSKSKITISTVEDGEEIMLSMENDKIVSLSINGKEIDEKDYPKYQDKIDALKGDIIIDFTDGDHNPFHKFSFEFPEKMFWSNDSLFRNYGEIMDKNRFHLDSILEAYVMPLGEGNSFKYNYFFDSLHNFDHHIELPKFKYFFDNDWDGNHFFMMPMDKDRFLYHEYFGEKNEQALQQLEEQMERLKEEGILQQEQLEKLREKGIFKQEQLERFREEGMLKQEQMERLRESQRALEFELNDFFPKNFEDRRFGSSTLSKRIGRELNRDGLLEIGKENKVELTGKHLKINGDKQPKNIYNKYKQLFEEISGAELTKKTKIELKIEGKKSNRLYKSI